MVMKERKTFVFVPSRTRRGYRTEGNFEVDPGRGEFLLCLLLNACVALFAKHGISRGVRGTSDLFAPISCPTLFMLMNVASHLFFNF